MTASVEDAHSANWVLMPTNPSGAQLAKATSRGYGLEEAKALYRDWLSASTPAPQGTVPANERDVMLEGLERLGWPCRLIELPEYAAELGREILSLRQEVSRLKAELSDVCTRSAEMANKAASGNDRLAGASDPAASTKAFGWFIHYPSQLPTISMITAPEFSRDRRTAEHLAAQCAQICGEPATLLPLFDRDARVATVANAAGDDNAARLHWLLERLTVHASGISMPIGNSKAGDPQKSIDQIDLALKARREHRACAPD